MISADTTRSVREKLAVNEVLETGILSKFLGCWHPDFYGGPKVKEFEKPIGIFWCSYVQLLIHGLPV